MALNIQRYVKYCMGEAYFDNRQYGQDLTTDKAEERLTRAAQETRDTQRTQLPRTLPTDNPLINRNDAFQIQSGVPETPLPVNNLFQQLLRLSARQALALFETLAQTQQSMKSFFDLPRGSVLGRLMSFFLGQKNHRIEEQKARNDDDFKEADLFDRYRVEATFASSGQNPSQ